MVPAVSFGSTMSNSIGVIGLSVMGASFAQNLSSKGFKVSVYNRSHDKTEELLHKNNNSIYGYKELEEFVDSLESPKKILLLVKSGTPVDLILEQLAPLLQSKDIIVDCGNSNWQDTELRITRYEGKFNVIGCGISGGESGALHGPSLMPGGNVDSIGKILPILQKVAAKDFGGKPCVTVVGNGASGHFVKMVHNGIEYAIMQGISEVYGIMKQQGYGNLVISEFMRSLNFGNLQSYLLDITVAIISTKDNEGNGFLLDRIEDTAKAKGTGGWSVEAGMHFGVAIPNIASAVMARTQSARNMSYLKRMQFESEESHHVTMNEEFKTSIYRTLEMVFLTSYLQGLDLIYQANEQKKWGIELEEIIRIWQGGCIIRSQMLGMLKLFWGSDNGWKTKLFAEVHADLGNIKQVCNQTDIPLPVIHSTYDYLRTLFSTQLATNLIQAQRDYFGAHGYERTDKKGVFTGGWN
jgi:6-phosphogluconate dehydrogenase